MQGLEGYLQSVEQPPRPPPLMSEGRPSNSANMIDEATLANALENRITYAENVLRNLRPDQRPTQIFYSVDLFAGDDMKLMRQVSLRATKCVQAYCHIMFDLTLLLGPKGKEVKDVARVR